jgi:WD40 repeat protein
VARAQQHELARTHAIARARTKYMGFLGVAFLAVVAAAVQLAASKTRLKGYENAWASIEQAATDPRAGLLQAARALDGYPDLVAVQQAVLDQLSQFEGSRLVVDLGTRVHPRTAAQRLFLDGDGRLLAFHLTGSGGAVSASPKGLAAAWTAGGPDEGTAWQPLLEQPGIDRLVASTADGACIVGGSSGRRLTVWERTETGPYVVRHSSARARPFTRVAVTDDCRSLFVGDIDGALAIIDLRSGATALTDTVSDGDSDAVAQIAASPSGWVAASTATGALAVWRSAPSGWRRSDVSASEGRTSPPVTALRFSADGQQLLVGDLAGTVVIWQVPAGDTTLRATDHLPPLAGPGVTTSAVASIDESGDGQWLVVSRQDGGFVLFERDGGRWRERAHQDRRSPSSIVDVRLSRDGRWLAALTEKHTAFLWRLPDVSFVGRSPWRPLRGHRGGEVTDLRFTADGRWLVSGGADGVIRRWDLAAPDPTDASVTYRARPEAGGRVSAMAISTDARWVATGLSDGAVTVTALTAAFAGSGSSSERERVACSAQGTVVGSLTISQDNRWLACRFVDGTLSVTALDSGSPSAAVIERGAEVADFSPGSRWLVVGRADGSIGVHDVRARFGEAAGIGVAPAASLSVPASRDAAGRRPLPVRVVATEDLSLVATGLDTGALHVWTAGPSAGTVRHRAPEQLLPEAGSARTAGPLRSLEASADGAWVTAVDVEGTAFVWHRASAGTFGRPVLRSSVSQPIRAVAVGDVRRKGASDRPELALVSGASDGTICILPLDARLAARARDTPGDSLCGGDEPFRVLGIGIHTLDLSGDGKKILARVSDGRVLLFDLARQHAFAVFIGRRYTTAGTSTLDAAMTSDGRGVLTLSDDWSVRSWRIDHDELRTQVAAVAGAMRNQ